MGRANAMHKPGERAPEAGTYYCYVCSLRGERSICEVDKGQLLLACPVCLDRKVPEWDMTWKSAEGHPENRRWLSSLWPGSLAKPA